MNKIITWIVAIVAVYGAVAGSVALVGGNQPAGSSSFGAATPGTRFPHGITLGLPANSPTNIGSMWAGSTALIWSFTNQPASTTVAWDISVPGIQSGDVVEAWFATSSAVGGGWQLIGSSASTTAGVATLRIANNTGASALLPASIASSTQYIVIRPQ